jgi:hypothetical protein
MLNLTSRLFFSCTKSGQVHALRFGRNNFMAWSHKEEKTMCAMKRLSAFLLTLFLASLPLSVQAAPVNLNTWYTFGWNDGVGSALVNGTGFGPITNPSGTPAPDPPWTFTLAVPEVLRVQDTFLSGDQFQMFDNAVSLGLTSLPTQGFDCGTDLSCAMANPAFSFGAFLLGVGPHSITGTLTLAASQSGGAAAFIIGPVPTTIPLPATLPLFATGLVGLGLLGWRRKRKAKSKHQIGFRRDRREQAV